MLYKPGDAVLAKDTEQNRLCRIPPGTAGFVAYVDDGELSLYLDLGYGLEFRCPLTLVGANFEKNTKRVPNGSYVRDAHFESRYPRDLLAP